MLLRDFRDVIVPTSRFLLNCSSMMTISCRL